ncbi:MAG: M28 family peptidase [Clostridia bacterium]|nr:M28 family peptidase [Clostridia bacterium]
MQTLKELKAALLGPYEVRKTWAQKSGFIAWAREYGARHGLSMQVEESGKLVRSRNLVFGEPEKADILLTAHYDTCAQLPFPNMMTPACWPIILLTQILLPVLVFGALGVGTGYLVGRTVGELAIPAGLSAALASLSVSALCFFAVWLMIAGPENPHTANDNTSGVALVLLAMEALCGQEDVAFVLFDNEEKGMLGSSAFFKRHAGAARRVFVLNADCVSDGGNADACGLQGGDGLAAWQAAGGVAFPRRQEGRQARVCRHIAQGTVPLRPDGVPQGRGACSAEREKNPVFGPHPYKKGHDV